MYPFHIPNISFAIPKTTQGHAMTKCYKDEKQAPKKSRYWSVNSELNCANLSLREKVDLNLTTSSPNY